MSNTFSRDLGVVTAYGYAVEGGYTGTEAEFEALLANLANDISDLENMTVTVTMLPAGTVPVSSYEDGVLTLNLPKGDTGATGATPELSIGTVSTGAPGTDASVTITGTAEEPVLNMTIPRGAIGEVSQAEFDALVSALTSGSEEDASYHLGFYLDENGDLCQVDD